MPVIEVKQQVWVPEIPDIELPSEDGEPLESKWHHLQINLLEDMLHQHWQDPTDYFVGGNMFVYYSLQQARNRDYKGPDFFVVKGVDGTRLRPSWIVWQEGGRYPDVIIELLSITTAAEDLGPKKTCTNRSSKPSNTSVSIPQIRAYKDGSWKNVNMSRDPRMSAVGCGPTACSCGWDSRRGDFRVHKTTGCVSLNPMASAC